MIDRIIKSWYNIIMGYIVFAIYNILKANKPNYGFDE